MKDAKAFNVKMWECPHCETLNEVDSAQLFKYADRRAIMMCEKCCKNVVVEDVKE